LVEPNGLVSDSRKRSVGRFEVEFSSKLSKQLDVVARSQIQNKPVKPKGKQGSNAKKKTDDQVENVSTILKVIGLDIINMHMTMLTY